MMKFPKILTILLQVIAATALTGDVVQEAAIDAMASDPNVGKDALNKHQRRELIKIPGSVRMSFYEYEKGGKKGGKKGHGEGKGKGAAAPTAPVESSPSSPVGCVGAPTDTDTPGCGEAVSPNMSPVADCETEEGCGSPVTAPSLTPPIMGGYGKGGGKGGGKKGPSGKKAADGGKGHGKGGSGKGYGKKSGGGNSPSTSPTGECGCEVDEIELDFLMFPYNTSVPVSSGSSLSTIGTVFIFSDVLLDVNTTQPLPGTFVGGLCHKTKLATGAGTDLTDVGGGYCFFTFTVSSGDATVTFTAQGEIFDVLGGTLAITGGTGELTGTYGEVELTPIYEEETDVDIFAEASLYIGAASLYVPLF